MATNQVSEHQGTSADLIFDDCGGEYGDEAEAGGVAVFVDKDGEEAVVDLDEVFARKLFREEDSGRLFLVSGEGKEDMKAVALSDLRSRHRVASGSFRVGPTTAKDTVKSAAFHEKRAGGFMVYWDLSSFYRLLGMTSYCNQPSKWIYSRSSTWCKSFEGTIGQGHIVYSTHFHNGNSRKVALGFEDRCLPFTGASTPGMLSLLCRWSYAPKFAGGLDDPTGQQVAASKTLLGGFLEPLASDVGVAFSMRIVVDGSWAPKWPRPASAEDRERTITLLVQKGIVDFNPLLAYNEKAGRLNYEGKAWAKMLSNKLAGDYMVPLGAFFEVCWGFKECASLYWQVVMRVALALEGYCGKVAGGGKVHGLDFQWDDGKAEMQGAHLGLKLAQYVLSSRAFLSKNNMYCMSSDKGAVRRLQLRNAYIVVPSGKAAVDKVFDNEQPAPTAGAATSNIKRAATQILCAAAKRQRAWLLRGKPGESSSWRPMKVFRVASKRWCDAFDLQFQVMSGREGLSYFVQKPPEKDVGGAWKDPMRWPYLVIGTDLGSDALSGYQSLERFFRLNTDLSADPAHGLHNDIKLSLSQCQMYGFWIVVICALNLPWGPEMEETRYAQVRQANLALHEGKAPWQVPLFQAFCADIAADLKRMGIDLPATESEEQEVFNYVAQRGFNVREGRRISMCRFMASIEGAEFHLPKWSLDCYEVVGMALELDLLKAGDLRRLVLKTGPVEELGENAGSTAPSRLTLEDRNFKGCFENAIVVSAAVRLDPEARRLVEIVVSITKLWRKWHGHMTKQLRSCDGAFGFWKEQLSTEFMKAVCDTVGCLSKVSDLENCMFSLTEGRVKETQAAEDVTEDDMADAFGQLVMSVCGHRLRRCLHYFGWPMKLFRILSGGDLALRTLTEFKDAWALWRMFDEQEDRGALLETIHKRSIFHKVSVQQLILICERCEWQVRRDLVDIITARAKLYMSTIPCEEMIGAQKNSKAVSSGRRFRKPECSMGAAIRGGVLDERSKFVTPSFDAAVESKTERLSKDCFQTKPSNRSLAFEKIASTKQSADYYSPQAQHLNTPHSDLLALEAASAKEEGFASLRHGWLTPLFTLEHRFVFKLKSAPAQHKKKWYYPLVTFPNSGIVAWPVVEKTLGGETMFELQTSLDEPCVLPLVDGLDEYLAWPVVWRSYSWQVRNLKVRASSIKKRITLFARGAAPDALFKVACKLAFWALSRTFVSQLAADRGINVDKGASVFEVIFQVISEGLGVDDDQVLDFLGRRLHHNSMKTQYAGPLLMIDDAIELYDKDDHEAVKSEKKSTSNALAERAEVSRQFVEKRAAVRTALAKAQAKANSGRRPAPKAAAAAPRRWPAQVSHQEAAQLIPPGCSVWRGLTRRVWCGHAYSCQAPRVSASWDGPGGEQESLRIVVGKLWLQYLEYNGLPRDQAPAGLFDEAA